MPNFIKITLINASNSSICLLALITLATLGGETEELASLLFLLHCQGGQGK
jgi:hypothetical protein